MTIIVKQVYWYILQLSLLWGYIHVYDHNIGIYPRSQVSIYRTIGPLVIMLVHLFEYLSQVNILTVSLTCIPCKLLEHIVCSNIMAHLDEHELLSDRPHAFRKWHSCETQLTTVINDWAKILDKKGQVDTFILDFKKAFDTPPHELLKSKLFSYGIGGTTLNWINAFLCFR